MSNLPPRLITVHAAATYPSMDIGVSEIRQWHLDRGWNDIGYHYVIRRDGTLEHGRPVNIIGAHVGNNNTKNIGICMAGGLKEGHSNTPEDNFTDKQYTQLTKLLIELVDKYPSVELKGHNDFPGYESRGCPCFNQHAYFRWFRLASKVMYKPDDWFNNAKYDWHEIDPEAWNIPKTFYDEVVKGSVKS